MLWATIAAAVIAVLLISQVFSMVGVGGAVLYTPLLFLLGFSALASISTSLVINLIAVLSASLIFYRKGLVDLRLAARFIPGVCVGALLGGDATGWVRPDILMWLFSAFLVLMGLRVMLSRKEQRTSGDACHLVVTPRLAATIVAFSLGVGFLSGLMGLGGSILIIPFLLYLCDQPVKGTAGTTAFIAIFVSLFGFIGVSAVDTLDIWLILPTAVAAVIGSQLGARRMVRTGEGRALLVLGIVMWIFAATLVLRLLGLV